MINNDLITLTFIISVFIPLAHKETNPFVFGFGG